MNKRHALLAALALGSATLGWHPAALAQADYPNRPVKIIVPFAAGGTSDQMGRLIADELSKQLKQPFIVDNKGGAGGAIGADQVAKAPADGYTLLLSGIGTNAVIHGFPSPRPNYRESDFIHISQLASGPNVLAVHPSFPARSFKEFVAYARANPGAVTFAQVPASSGHLSAETIRQTAGLDTVNIPYKGGSPALTDVLGNQVSAIVTNQDVLLPYVKSGKLRALAVTSAERNPLYPDVPTVAESGYPGFSAVSWTGLSAPKGTPKAVIERLESAMQKAFQEPAARAKLENNGFVVVASKSVDYTRFVNDEERRWTEVIRKGGLKPE